MLKLVTFAIMRFSCGHASAWENSTPVMVFWVSLTLHAIMMKHRSKPFLQGDFDHLADVCRGALKMAESADEVALSHLHLRNYHPEHLAAYGGLAGGSGTAAGWTRKVLRQAALPILAMKQQPRAWFGDALPERADVLFLSHFNSIAQCKFTDDLYFGDIPEQFEKTLGRSVFIASIDHTWLGQQKIQKEWVGGAVPRVVLSRLSTGLRELAYARRLRKAARSKAYPGGAVGRGLQKLIANDPVTGSALTALRTAEQVTQLVKSVQPKVIIATYEGHPWERLAFQSAREAKPDITCVGYHHTMLVPGTSCSGWIIGKGFDPDVILTSGDLARTWFRRQPDLAGVSVETLGSIKASQNESAHKPLPEGQSCLVAPEGILSEVLLLLELALKAARQLPDHEFVVRLHPVLDRSSIERALQNSASRPANFRWSTEDLDQDLARAGSLLYRGSSVVFNAVRAGVRPIYFASERSSFSIDPLDPVPQGWRRKVTSAGELACVLSETPSVEGRAACQAHGAASFAPIDLGVLDSLLPN